MFGTSPLTPSETRHQQPFGPKDSQFRPFPPKPVTHKIPNLRFSPVIMTESTSVTTPWIVPDHECTRLRRSGAKPLTVKLPRSGDRHKERIPPRITRNTCKAFVRNPLSPDYETETGDRVLPRTSDREIDATSCQQFDYLHFTKRNRPTGDCWILMPECRFPKSRRN